MTASCTCTTFGRCEVCRPPCMWVVAHLEEVPVRCGDDHFGFVGNLPVCLDHLQFYLLHQAEGASV